MISVLLSIEIFVKTEVEEAKMENVMLLNAILLDVSVAQLRKKLMLSFMLEFFSFKNPGEIKFRKCTEKTSKVSEKKNYSQRRDFR